MLRRWIKRTLLAGLLVAMALIPAQLAQGPTQAQAAEAQHPGAATPFHAFTPTSGIVLLLAVTMLIYTWRRKHAS